uniref:Uncharacterized protein n=1 Tax=Rhizophora mucronata TaxID=61149 RepID=A0A2P2QBQ9_RHIMU
MQQSFIHEYPAKTTSLEGKTSLDPCNHSREDCIMYLTS